MNYLILSGIVLALALGYDTIKSNTKYKKSFRFIILGLIVLILCLFAGLRTEYNDTSVYIYNYAHTPKEFSKIFDSSFSLSDVYLFKLWQFFIYNFISHNANVFLFLSSIVFVVPSVLLLEKYSRNFSLSMLLFMFAGMYLFSLAGLKQAMATGFVLLGFPFLINRKYGKYCLFCLLAIGFHAYVIFFLILPLLGVEILNKRTVVFSFLVIAVGIGMSYFSGLINRIVELLGKDVSEETIESGSVNIFRALVFVVPFVLTCFAKNKLNSESTEAEKIFVKTGVLSSVFMVLALFGSPILFGRIPQYFIIGIVVSLPILIQFVFKAEDRTVIIFLAVVAYIAFGVYQLYNDGAFAGDIFKLIWP